MRKKIGIFLPGANGDIMAAMGILKYKDEFWPDDDLVWFCNEMFKDLLSFGPVVEWREWGPYIDAMTPEYRLDLSKKNDIEGIQDLSDGYFVAPKFMPLETRISIGDHLSLCSKHVFNVPKDRPWHPYLCFSEEEKTRAYEFFDGLPKCRKTIMIETSCHSRQSLWNDNMTAITMQICREILGPCNFIFASKPDNSQFFDESGVVSCSDFTVRQTSLINDYCDLFVGISSGISVATSSWCSKPIPKIQYCTDYFCSTFPLAVGPIELVTAIREHNMSKNADGHVSVVDNPEISQPAEFARRLRLLLPSI